MKLKYNIWDYMNAKSPEEASKIAKHITKWSRKYDRNAFIVVVVLIVTMFIGLYLFN